MKVSRGDLFGVLSELGASSDALTVAEELLRQRLVSSSDLFVGWIDGTPDDRGLQVVYVGVQGFSPVMSSSGATKERPSS